MLVSCNPTSQFYTQTGFPNTHLPMLLLMAMVNVAHGKQGAHLWIFKPRPTPIQTDPKSKTSNVWARGKKAMTGTFSRAHVKEVGRKAGFLRLSVLGSQPGREWPPCQPGAPASVQRFQPPSRYTHNQLGPVFLPPGAPDGPCQEATVVLLQT